MVEISNKVLAVIVFATLVVIVAGTFFNFQAVRQYGSLTGFATSDTGYVNLSIASTLAIAVDTGNNTINFGACAPRAATSYTCGTNDTLECDGSVANNCTGDTATPQFIRVDNVGNVNAAVNITNNECDASTFIGGTSPGFRYATTHCNGTGVVDWTSFTAGAQQTAVCTNLSYLGGKLQLYANVTIPNNAVGSTGGCSGNQSTITFSAIQIA